MTTKQDNTRVVQAPVLDMATMQAYFNSPQGKQARALYAQYQQQRRNSDIKAATDHKLQSDNTRVTYRNPVIQREQTRKNLTNREKALRDYPVSTIQDPATQAINYVVPIVGPVAAATDVAEGIQDIRESGLNLENASQTGLSVLPLIPLLKPLVKPALSFIKDTLIANWRPFVPWNPSRYYRIVGETGNPIGDAIESGVIRGPGAVPGFRTAVLATENPNTITLRPKAHSYPMFSKGKPWGGSTARRDFGKPTIIRSKADTGPIVWEESNKLFRHKGHAGIFRPNYYGELNSAPTRYFEYWEPKRFGYIRRDFPVDTNPYHNLMGRGYTVNRGSWTESNLGVEGEQFGKYVGSGGEQTVFEDLSNKNKVLKVYNDTYTENLNDMQSLVNSYLQRNTIPLQLPTSFRGYIKQDSYLYPVFSQEKVQPIGQISSAEYVKTYLPLVLTALKKAGYDGDGVTTGFTNGIHTLVDLKPENMGINSSGNLRFFDVDLVNN